jgi:hypothetical protein
MLNNWAVSKSKCHLNVARLKRRRVSQWAGTRPRERSVSPIQRRNEA